MRSLLFLATLLFCSLALPASAEEKAVVPKLTAENAWTYTAPKKPAVPAARDRSRVANPIDAFVLARLEARGLTLNAPADKLTLLRRVTVDLTGLPPTVAEQEAFLADNSVDAYVKVVQRLLDSQRYGERQAQHWLDLVRYAETDGFKADDFRPLAHKYRDYVIRAFNADLPYDRFLRQQLAGDELEPGNPEALVATGFNRLYPDEYNAANLEQRRQEILDDVTDVTGSVFLGLTMGCARCHDHKFDPILQTDYFKLQAFFAPMRARDDLIVAGADQRQRYQEQLAAWEKATSAIREEMEAILGKKPVESRQQALKKFRPEIQQAIKMPEKDRTPYQQQIACMAEKQLTPVLKTMVAKLPAEKKKRYEELEKQLAAVPGKPEPLPAVMALTDIGTEAPPTHRLQAGDWRKPKKEVQPGFPEILGAAAVDTSLPAGTASTGRRAALARWLTRPDHPLTVRVLANRLWQQHFGVGIVGTPNDFGLQGDKPTHPELLDWLAVEFVEHGWSVKYLHRLMVTSAAYCQGSTVDAREHVNALALDREDKLLWHARRRRLESEAVRDGMLALAGELNTKMYGTSAKPKLPANLSSYAWKPDARTEDQNRRSIYVLAKRNLRYPLFDVFDYPDMHNSCARRSQTTTAPQALLMLNGDFTLERAQAWSTALTRKLPGDAAGQVNMAYQMAWGRVPTREEIEDGVKFIESQADGLRASGKNTDEAQAAALADFCHAVLNANEFLYVD
jgi:hypothetical protein